MREPKEEEREGSSNSGLGTWVGIDPEGKLLLTVLRTMGVRGVCREWVLRRHECVAK